MNSPPSHSSLHPIKQKQHDCRKFKRYLIFLSPNHFVAQNLATHLLTLGDTLSICFFHDSISSKDHTLSQTTFTEEPLKISKNAGVTLTFDIEPANPQLLYFSGEMTNEHALHKCFSLARSTHIFLFGPQEHLDYSVLDDISYHQKRKYILGLKKLVHMVNSNDLQIDQIIFSSTYLAALDKITPKQNLSTYIVPTLHGEFGERNDPPTPLYLLYRQMESILFLGRTNSENVTRTQSVDDAPQSLVKRPNLVILRFGHILGRGYSWATPWFTSQQYVVKEKSLSKKLEIKFHRKTALAEFSSVENVISSFLHFSSDSYLSQVSQSPTRVQIVNIVDSYPMPWDMFAGTCRQSYLKKTSNALSFHFQPQSGSSKPIIGGYYLTFLSIILTLFFSWVFGIELGQDSWTRTQFDIFSSTITADKTLARKCGYKPQISLRQGIYNYATYLAAYQNRQYL